MSKKNPPCCLLLITLLLPVARQALAEPRWTPEQARGWYAQMPWLVGCNFSPSTAINQLEMWQADTFDPATIDRELGWAQELGFNSVRVFLHDIPWREDSKAFLGRIDGFLEICDRHRIGVMFVLLDSCWDPSPKAGKQRDPRPHVHNSGWVQSPGIEILRDPARHGELEGYVKGIIGRYRNDKRVQVWDIFNEPDNRNDSSYGQQDLPDKAAPALLLLKRAYGWARECDPIQPITSGVWHGDWSKPQAQAPMVRFQLEESDVVTFHNYSGLGQMKVAVESLKRLGRPILCTEYMARPAGSTFKEILPYLKEQRVGAYNWGFVAGKTQTIYPWDSWKKTYTAEPPVWFHDIFRSDGRAYDPAEVQLIRQLTQRGQ